MLTKPAPVPATAVAGSTDILAVANSPVVWACALGVFSIILIQTFIYIRAARQAGPDAGMSPSELSGAFRSGAIASVGPSLAVVMVAIALLALFGTPAVLVRIGLIGSAAAETASAGIAATTMGATLGGAGYTQSVFAVAFMAMSLSGGMWMLATLILTPLLKRGSTNLAKVNPAAMAVIPTAALLGAFSMLAVAELPKSTLHTTTLAVSAAVMVLCLFVSKLLKAHWLKEWALGFSIVAAVAVAFVLHTA